jgi:DNA-binding MarR family transcriptional regulator
LNYSKDHGIPGIDMSEATYPEALSRLLKEMLSLMSQSATGDTMAIMAEEDLTLPQVATMQALAATGPRNVSSIADLLNLSRPATSHLVDRLVSMGFVSRAEDPADRRQKRIEITAAGAGLIDRLGQSQRGQFAQAMAGLPEQLQDELADVLAEVVQQLRRRLTRETRQVGQVSVGEEVVHDSVA